MRVLAAMSGGVDSAVAAALAVDAGHDVTGVHLALSPDRQTLRSGARGCCSVEDAHDARRVADELGIPFYVWDLADRFREEVVDDFVAEYAAGRTPNPCLRCNEKIKFTAVLDRARALGFDAVVTGHHARLSGGALRRSVDAAKDQSYVLGVLTEQQLAAAMFPLGSMTKERVREIAAERGFAVAAKPDSHDICFIPDGDTRGFLNRKLGSRPGPVVDAATGATVGEHEGTYGFTVGQRRGLGVSVGDQRPRYVLAIEPVTRTVTGRDAGPGRGRPRCAPACPTWTGAAPRAPVRGAGAAPGACGAGRLRGRGRRRRGTAHPARRRTARSRSRAVRRAVRAGRRAGRPGARPGGRETDVDARNGSSLGLLPRSTRRASSRAASWVTPVGPQLPPVHAAGPHRGLSRMSSGGPPCAERASPSPSPWHPVGWSRAPRRPAPPRSRRRRPGPARRDERLPRPDRADPAGTANSSTVPGPDGIYGEPGRRRRRR